MYTLIVPGGGFLLPSSHFPGGGGGGGNDLPTLDEIDTCISSGTMKLWALKVKNPHSLIHLLIRLNLGMEDMRYFYH